MRQRQALYSVWWGAYDSEVRASGTPGDVVVSDPADWRELAPLLDAVVDPMVFRVADRFLAGRSGDDDRDDTVWRAIKMNTSSLMAFLDLLVFSEQLPLIDYGMTFGTPEGYTVAVVYDIVRELTAQISPSTAPPLVSVHVGGAAHNQASEAALISLTSHGAVEHALAESIAEELSAFDHAWRPDLSNLDPRYQWGECDDADRRVATFIYGGLLFAEFANQAQVPHFLHDKRARLDLAVALDATSAGFDAEARLDDELTQILRAELQRTNLWIEGSQALPSVLPYLLAHYDPQTPMELVLRALELRSTTMAAEYRAWKTLAVEEFGQTLTVSPALERDLRASAVAIERALEPASSGFEFMLKVIPVPTVMKDRLWSWALSSVPGRNHVKMLYRLQLHDRAASRVDKMRSMETRLRRLWSATDQNLRTEAL